MEATDIESLRQDDSPQARTTTYGACKAELVFHSDIHSSEAAEEDHEWKSLGAPFTLLVDAFTALVQVAVPLMLIVYENWVNKSYTARCANRKFGYSMQMMCEITRLHLRFFPDITSQFAVLAVSWRLIRTRAFYRLLPHRILVRFPTKPIVSQQRQVLILLWFLAMALCHWTIMLLYTKPRGRMFNGNNHDSFLPDMSVNDVFKKPSLVVKLMNDESTPAMIFLPRVFSCYIVPAIVSIFVVAYQFNLPSTLMPLSMYVLEGSEGACQSLSHTLCVPEDAVAAAVEQMSIRNEPSDWANICEELHQRLTSEEAPPTTTSVQLQSKRDELPWQPVACWSTKLLLQNNVVDEDSRAFKHCWRIFHMGSILLLGYMLFSTGAYIAEAVEKLVYFKKAMKEEGGLHYRHLYVIKGLSGAMLALADCYVLSLCGRELVR